MGPSRSPTHKAQEKLSPDWCMDAADVKEGREDAGVHLGAVAGSGVRLGWRDERR